MKRESDRSNDNDVDRILCIGHCALDINFQIGEAIRENRKYRSTSRLIEGGGPAANAAAVAAAWSGPGRSYYAGPVGTDDFGYLLAAKLEYAGIDCRFVRRIPEYPTPVSCILSNNADGKRTIINHRIVEDLYSLPEDLTYDDDWRVVLGDGHCLAAMSYFIKIHPGVPSVLDAGSYHSGTAGLYRIVDYLIASSVFAGEVLKTDIEKHLESPEDMRNLLQKLKGGRDQFVAVTAGEKGTWFIDDLRGFGRCRAMESAVEDSTAAGDIFHGAFAYCIAKSWDIEKSLVFSSIAAGLSVEKHGGMTSIPPMDAVEERFGQLNGNGFSLITFYD